jgi:hypothetical protein
MHVEYRWESQKERNHYEHLDVSWWIIIKWILQRYDETVWIGLIRLRIRSSGGLL